MPRWANGPAATSGPRGGRTRAAPWQSRLEALTRRASFPVHSYEVDAIGTLEVPALSGYLQEVAGLHAGELGVGLDALRAKGLTWVLARQRIEILLPVTLGDTVEIETWPTGIERLAATRDFVVRRGDGAEAARATTQWYVLDLATRRPVRPAEVLDPRFPREPRPPVAPLAAGRLASPATWDVEKRFHVRYADIDVNMHVTNASYVTWAIERRRWSCGARRASPRSRCIIWPRDFTERRSCRASRAPPSVRTRTRSCARRTGRSSRGSRRRGWSGKPHQPSASLDDARRHVRVSRPRAARARKRLVMSFAGVEYPHRGRR